MTTCKDDYLTKTDTMIPIESIIYVLPDRAPNSYQVVLGKATNAKYSIESAPEWLKLDTKTGQFVNGVTYLSCSAIKQDNFSNAGIYNATIILHVEGVGLCFIQVGYINEGFPTIESNTKNIDFSSTDKSIITLTNHSEGILIWEVVEYPEWVNLSVHTGYTLSNSTSITEATFSPVLPDMNSSKGTIVIANNSLNSQEYEIEVNYTSGSPVFICHTNTIDFGRSIIQENVSFHNGSYDLLNWVVEECPEWINISKNNGSVSATATSNITITCNREKLTEGSYTGIIVFRTNGKEHSTHNILVKCSVGRGNSTTVLGIEGAVRDAVYDKSRDILYIATQNPDQLIVFDAKTKKIIHTISFNLAPTCIDLSEDGKNAIVGHGGFVSYIDLTNQNVIKYWEINFSAFDIVLVNDEWCLISAKYDYHKPIWLNIKTGIEKVFDDIGGRYVFKKIPGKEMIIGSRLDVTPHGLYIINAKTQLTSQYFHESGIGFFWLSSNSDRIFCSWSDVYNMPSASATDISPVGRFEALNDFFWGWIYALDHSVPNNCLWLLAKPWNNNSVLLKYNTSNYSIIKQYFYEDYFTTINGVTDMYITSAHYVFANNNGAEIYLIKNISEQYKADAWSIEWMTID